MCNPCARGRKGRSSAPSPTCLIPCKSVQLSLNYFRARGLTCRTLPSCKGTIRSLVVRPSRPDSASIPAREASALPVARSPSRSWNTDRRTPAGRPLAFPLCSSKRMPRDVLIIDARRPSWLRRSRLGVIHGVTRRSVPSCTLRVRRKPTAIPALQPSQNVAPARRPAYLPTVRIVMNYLHCAA